jgi:hypothetical protein
MFDLYRLPADFPGVEQAQHFGDSYEKVRYLEDRFAADIIDSRFIPYLQLHEFEGLLFSDVQAIDAVLKVRHNASQLATLQQIRTQFNTAEEINNGETTAPSKRLQRLYASYDKVLFGPLIVQRIGLDSLRQECPHFHAWVSKLEALSEVVHGSA